MHSTSVGAQCTPSQSAVQRVRSASSSCNKYDVSKKAKILAQKNQENNGPQHTRITRRFMRWMIWNNTCFVKVICSASNRKLLTKPTTKMRWFACLVLNRPHSPKSGKRASRSEGTDTGSSSISSICVSVVVRNKHASTVRHVCGGDRHSVSA